ncbi:hypothetical protein SODALDRAFT_341584 [Sodiomyces alkalinus F11]|uniref:Secreted protein n=1 Tax=Sodiomyces alkalinus (strain CBS 110278 / VKM F-3762 / F11) TaxID=1314773 RepID=A0A3N2Q5C4_SODAK|nr:hypothetical protein SODALDRAFT_341584 [Sodiomyces alkalinus F11]ROT41973.1 hypothetical protein SODALDRAFT_341584 [Sodiomyces alkalinus F11]
MWPADSHGFCLLAAATCQVPFVAGTDSIRPHTTTTRALYFVNCSFPFASTSNEAPASSFCPRPRLGRFGWLVLPSPTSIFLPMIPAVRSLIRLLSGSSQSQPLSDRTFLPQVNTYAVDRYLTHTIMYIHMSLVTRPRGVVHLCPLAWPLGKVPDSPDLRRYQYPRLLIMAHHGGGIDD